MKCKYTDNKSDAVHINTDPSLADQAGADATNINVILKQFKITGRIQGHDKQHLDMDFALLPSDLRTMIETTREIGKMRNSLPRELREIPWDTLESMTTAELTAILTPPAPPPANEEKK